jgi:predicted nucleic acid-binding protein
MTACFADTAYFIALVSPSDLAHESALRLAGEMNRSIVTTSGVITELANHLSKPAHRPLFLGLFDDLSTNPQFRVVHVDATLHDEALSLFRQRTDKSWSLIDCISFIVMRRDGIKDALTTDHHFEQAGFNPLLQIQ